jgi:ubiquinol-cytochrome c reductase iron-sulfur subunit
MRDGQGGGGLKTWLLAAVVRLVLRALPASRGRGRHVPVHPGEPPPTVERELPADPRWERLTLLALGLGALAAAGFMVFYIVFPNTQLLGLCLGLAFVFLAVAAVTAGKRLVPQEKVVEEYPDFGDEAEQIEVAEMVRRGADGISRRRALMAAAGAAGTTLGAAALFPLASLGPRVDDQMYETPWRAGRRVVDAEGRPLTADDVPDQEFRTGFPEGATQLELGSPIVLVRVPLDQVRMPAARKAKMPEGIIGYSKICTHAGCAISMYRHPRFPDVEPVPALVCPCHYSTFDVRRGGAVLFGPAGRPLPQLPLRLNARRELVADGDFFDNPGPSWSGVRQRGRRT